MINSVYEVGDLKDLVKDVRVSMAYSAVLHEKVQVGKDQEKAQLEKDSHSKNRGGKKKQTNNQVLIP